jgi:hypothetical protein
MLVDGARADVQNAANLLVPFALRNPKPNLRLPFRQSEMRDHNGVETVPLPNQLDDKPMLPGSTAPQMKLVSTASIRPQFHE